MGRVPEVASIPGDAAACRVAVVAQFNLTGDSMRVALCRHGFEVCAMTIPASTTETREMDIRLGAFAPDVVVMVQELPDPAHLVAALRTISELREHRWLLLTATPVGSEWGSALAAGATGVLPLTMHVDRLIRSVGRVCRGEPVMSPRDRERLIALWEETTVARRDLMDRLATLTHREMEVLQALHEGRRVADIAKERGVSVGTVRSQVKAVLRKLEVSSQLAAVAALQRVEVDQFDTSD